MDPISPRASVRELLARTTPARPSTSVLATSLARSGWMHSVAPGSGGPPRLFVGHEALHEHALGVESLALRGYASVAKPWGMGLAELLAEGCEQVVLDAGGGIELALDRSEMAAVAAAFAFDRLASEHELVVLLRRDKVHFQLDARGEPCGVAFRSLDEAERWVAERRSAFPDLRCAVAPAALVLDGFLGTGVGRVALDPGLPGEDVLVRDVLEITVALMSEGGHPVDPETSSEGSESPVSAEASLERPAPSIRRVARDENAEPLARASAPRRRPGRSGALARERVREIRALAAETSSSPWAVAECLANDVDLWVPIGARSLDGMHWPALVRSRDGASGDRLRAEFFSSEEDARRGEGGVAALSGIEAFRWSWSSPYDVAEVVVDPHDAGGWQLTDREILPMLFPSIAPVRDLDLVQDVPVERLSHLPWLHGLKPEVVRFFAKSWSRLYGPPLDGSQPPIPFGGGMYLPVFSHPDRFYEFTRRGPYRAPTPQVVGSKPPFLRWLRLSTRCSGVVVDPASSHAFAIETTDLFFLQLWAEISRAPDGRGVTQTLAELQAGDYSVDQRTAGRVAADWPLYLAARPLAARGERNELLAVPGTGDLALFTSERGLDDFARLHRKSGVVREELECVHALPRWRSSLFHVAHERFLGVRIDVGSSGGGDGVHLDGKGLDGALERLEERLRPRVTELRTGR